MSYTRDSENDLVYDANTDTYVPVPTTVTLTITPTPSDATVTLTATGFTQDGNSITVDPDTVVSYSVTKTGYTPVTSSITVSEDTVLPITLTITQQTLTINPTPADATVTFSTGTVSGNSCTVDYGTSVTYTVSKLDWFTQTATVTVTSTQTINVELIKDTRVHIQLLRGTDVQTAAYTGRVGELTYSTDTKTLRVHDGSTAGGHVIGVQKSIPTNISLVAANWSSNTQTVNITGVTATNTIFVSPTPASTINYVTAGVLCTAQASGTLTFTCETTPTVDIDLNIVILD